MLMQGRHVAERQAAGRGPEPHRRDGDERGCVRRIRQRHGCATALAAAQLAARQQVVLRHHAQRCLRHGTRSRVQGLGIPRYAYVWVCLATTPSAACATVPDSGSRSYARLVTHMCKCDSVHHAQRCLCCVSAGAGFRMRVHGCIHASTHNASGGLIVSHFVHVVA